MTDTVMVSIAVSRHGVLLIALIAQQLIHHLSTLKHTNTRSCCCQLRTADLGRWHAQQTRIHACRDGQVVHEDVRGGVDDQARGVRRRRRVVDCHLLSHNAGLKMQPRL